MVGDILPDNGLYSEDCVGRNLRFSCAVCSKSAAEEGDSAETIEICWKSRHDRASGPKTGTYLGGRYVKRCVWESRTRRQGITPVQD